MPILSRCRSDLSVFSPPQHCVVSILYGPYDHISFFFSVEYKMRPVKYIKCTSESAT